MTDDPKAAERERIRNAAQAIVDGVFFNLPAEVYHAVQRLNTSGLQAIDISPADFWVDSFLNDDAPELDEESTKAQQLGKAYHCARLEPHLFEAQFCRQPSKSELPDGALTTEAAIKAALKELGEPETVKDDGGVLGKARRLAGIVKVALEYDPSATDEIKAVARKYDVPIWHIIEADWEAQRNGRTAIGAKYWDDIIVDMERIHKNADIAPLLSDGAAEVSIFWTDVHGLKMKTRLDYLRVDGWADLKTFANPNGKKLDQVLRDAMMYNRLHVQAVVQRDAVEAIRYGKVDIIGDASEAERDLFAAIQISPGDLRMDFVFIQKGGVPNMLAMEFPFFDVPDNIEQNWDSGATAEQKAAAHAATRTSTALHNIGRRTIEAAKTTFVLYSQVYQHGQPWFPIEGRRRWDDADFPPYFLEHN